MKLIRAAALLMMLLVCFASLSAAQAAPTYTPGDTIDDFTVTTYDGRTITLSEVLQEKDAVLINIWASWCGPCRNEFPYMEEAYRQYSDRIEVIALSCEESDSDADLAAFAEKLGLTFPIARDTVNMAYRLQASSIPTTIMVDRFGTICFRVSGSMPDTESFIRLFDAFVGDSYTESRVYEGLPPAKASAAHSPESEIAAALGAEAALNPVSPYTWPMIVTEKDGRSVVASTSQRQSNATAEVSVHVTAAAGDAVVVTFKTATEEVFDLLTLRLNGQPVKVFSGEHDWMTYAIPVTQDGLQTIGITYVKNGTIDAGEDTVWVDEVAVVSGSDAEAALAANPAWPVAGATALRPVSDGVREVVIGDPNGLLRNTFGNAKYYIAGADTVTFAAELAADADPERAFFYTNYDNTILPITSSLTDGRFTFTAGVDGMDTTGYVCSSVCLYLDAARGDMQMAVCFRDEKNLEALVSHNPLDGWSYVQESTPEAAQSAYTVRFVDQHGAPVAGVILQVCDEETCMLYTSDENGVCSFTLAPWAWELHTLKVPAGYEGDTQTVTHAPEAGGEVIFTLTKL